MWRYESGQLGEMTAWKDVEDRSFMCLFLLRYHGISLGVLAVREFLPTSNLVVDAQSIGLFRLYFAIFERRFAMDIIMTNLEVRRHL